MVVLLIALVAGVLALSLWVAPDVAAGGLLARSRRALYRARPSTCVEATFEGAGVRLAGWRCAATAARRGTLVYLHGIADNRSGAAGVVERFGPLGYDVVAYDSRAHGASEGAWCTYGIREREDLRRVIATLPARPVVLIGGSLGAAVALQTAAIEPRVTAVVAAEVFSTLREVAIERGRRLWLPPWTIARALAIAERRGGFRVDEADTVGAARRIRVPVLLLHGAADTATRPVHSQRVYDALTGDRQLRLVPGVGHSQTLPAPGVWDAVQRWIEGRTLPRPRVGPR